MVHPVSSRQAGRKPAGKAMKSFERAVHSLVGNGPFGCVEALEARAMMSVSAGIDAISVVSTGVFATIHYRSDQPIDTTTIGNGDIRMVSDAQTAPIAQPAFSQASVIVGAPTVQSDGSVTARYFMSARG